MKLMIENYKKICNFLSQGAKKTFRFSLICKGKPFFKKFNFKYCWYNRKLMINELVKSVKNEEIFDINIFLNINEQIQRYYEFYSIFIPTLNEMM